MNTISHATEDTGLRIGSRTQAPLGRWEAGDDQPAFTTSEQIALLRRVALPLYVILDDERVGLAEGGTAVFGESSENDGLPLIGFLPACRPESLGDASFCRDHRLRFPYMAGAMANGIASVEIVEAMSRHGMLGIFGSAGLPLERVEQAIDRLIDSLGSDGVFGVNLIHSPNESKLESELVDLFIDRGVHLIEASAFLRMTPAVVRYRLHGIYRDETGRVVTPNRIIAKLSRVEIATKFFEPPPEKILAELVASGDITEEQAEMAREIPTAQDVTAEADSGGHTDNRPALAMLPSLIALRDRVQREHGYDQPLRLGLGGGISTPASAAAAFALGAAYILTGSVNQACVESGTSDLVREMLAEAQQADVATAPAADMFEMGVNVQVLKRGTMFSMRATKLYALYREHAALEEIPPEERDKLEKSFFRMSLEEVWAETRAFFTERDPRQVERAEKNPKHKMALVFRWYLGQSSHWANGGVSDRKLDFQVWCGPAMGAFNEWAKGSFFDDPARREAGVVGLNLLYGATALTRVNALKMQGLSAPPEMSTIPPLEEDELWARLGRDLAVR